MLKKPQLISTESGKEIFNHNLKNIEKLLKLDYTPLKIFKELNLEKKGLNYKNYYKILSSYKNNLEKIYNLKQEKQNKIEYQIINNIIENSNKELIKFRTNIESEILKEQILINEKINDTIINFKDNLEKTNIYINKELPNLLVNKINEPIKTLNNDIINNLKSYYQQLENNKTELNKINKHYIINLYKNHFSGYFLLIGSFIILVILTYFIMELLMLNYTRQVNNLNDKKTELQKSVAVLIDLGGKSIIGDCNKDGKNYKCVRVERETCNYEVEKKTVFCIIK